MLKAEDINLQFTELAIREIAKVAAKVNSTDENIGARRLHTVLERIIEEVSFDAPDMPRKTTVVISKSVVLDKTKELLQKTDLSKYIL